MENKDKNYKCKEWKSESKKPYEWKMVMEESENGNWA